jgi:hypothetical protein
MRRRARVGWIATLGVVLLHSACSKGGDKQPKSDRGGAQPSAAARTSPAAAGKPDQPAAPVTPEPPATLTDVNLVAADMGGAVEELTGSYGAGLVGRRLIDGGLDQAWTAPADWSPNMSANNAYWVKYPQDIVFSFYERKAALVGAVAITPPAKPTVPVPDSLTGPVNVEIWTAMDSAPASRPSRSRPPKRDS